MRGLCFGFVALVIAGGNVPAYGQQYPEKSVRIIVPFSTVGGTDFIARLVASKLTSSFGKQFLVDNRPGAASTLGTEVALKSPADGYTLLLTSGSYTVAPSLYNLRYDPLKDMTPIIQLDDGPFILVTHPSLPVRNIKEFVALAKARPGEINYATSGVGSITHLSTELFAMISGIKLTHIPYKGNGQSITDTMAGHIQCTLAAFASALPLITSGRLRAIAVSSAERNPALPEVPTVMESGYKYEVSNWHGLLGPKDMPREVVETLNGAINKIIKNPEFVRQIAGDGLVASGGLPERLLQLITDEMKNWARVANALGLKAE